VIVPKDFHLLGWTFYRKLLFIIRIAGSDEPPRTEPGNNEQHRQRGSYNQQYSIATHGSSETVEGSCFNIASTRARCNGGQINQMSTE